ncbi:MAG: ribosome biogenesis factor YjgA [Methylobacter sp.]|uniref:ribosome biogenesis factor YjgA n=1 Tax=Methylobacter sp. TaxID=2051955 RepID=UPI00272FA957|nr:ribosome biogenesis factor YjgA [Methylobacter sp.]MDP1664262.1 ribosome biogenesis factor YjgA [Methylobacter sp.]MDP1971196.1 ribosome biogenesis factor YjgA [Methylobacter sp.]
MSEEYEYDDEAEEYYAIRPNKTQIKKDMAVLFALSEEMSELPAGQLKTLELPEIINKAVVEVSGMPHKGARKRLLKFIAGQLNKIDIEPILEKLSRIKNKSAHAVREHHIVERWRDRLIAEGNDALTELLDEQPHADRQLLRQLLRNAQKETETGKPPKSSRLLYRQLKELFKVEGEPDDESGFEDEQEDD